MYAGWLCRNLIDRPLGVAVSSGIRERESGENVNPHLPCRAGSGAAVGLEPLEDRRLLAAFFFSFSDGDVGFAFSSGPHLPPAPVSSLPSQNLGLPHQDLALPAQPLTLPNSTPEPPKPDFHVRGFYSGTISIPGLGNSTTIALSITRQRRGTISATLSIPTFGRSVSATVPITFEGSRRFSTTIVRGSDSAALTVRLNRDNSLTGQLTSTIGGLNFNGTLSMARLSA